MEESVLSSHEHSKDSSLEASKIDQQSRKISGRKSQIIQLPFDDESPASLYSDFEFKKSRN